MALDQPADGFSPIYEKFYGASSYEKGNYGLLTAGIAGRLSLPPGPRLGGKPRAPWVDHDLSGAGLI